MTSLVSARDSITELFRERPGATVPAAWAALPRVDMDALFTDDPGAGGLASSDSAPLEPRLSEAGRAGRRTSGPRALVC